MSAIIGISAFYHDSAAAIIIDGKVIAAAQEERFTRKKHDSSFPINSIKYLLFSTNLKLSEISYIVFYDKPLLKFERLLDTYIASSPRGFNSFKKSMPLWLRDKLFLKNYLVNKFCEIDKNFNKEKLLFTEHHLSHAASAFYPSPFKKALILVIDGVGEWATTSVCLGSGSSLKILKEIKYPHSIGLLYSAFTYYLGFKVNGGEYKLMGLAPYGKPIFKEIIYENLINVKNDGSFRINQSFFNYSTGLTMTNNNFNSLFKRNVRNPKEENLTQFHMDVASSIQVVVEETILKICKSLKNEFSENNLCLAGGVALNCVVNGKILDTNIFKNIWVQPAAGDAGGALGAALAVWYIKLKKIRQINPNDGMNGSLLGPSYNESFIKSELDSFGANYKYLSEKKLYKVAATEISRGKVVGWFQGKMEFGPRSLGNRSILADPRDIEMQKKLNLKIKFRESFRPFAPSILQEYSKEFFDLKSKSPYMLFVADINKKMRIKISNEIENRYFGIDKLKLIRSKLPCITHVNFSARIQTVDIKNNKKYYNLISQFYKITGYPVLVNTSFNVRGEPIVCSPYDAYKCFMSTNIDILILENFILYKDDQYKNLFT